MSQKAGGKSVRFIALLFASTYMISYMTRINFGAIVSAMESQTGFSKSLLSMSLTGSFVTYGIGQILSGLCGDRFSPKKLVSAGLATTVLMNLCLPLCRNPYAMMLVWCVNGLAQAFMWPPMVRLMTGLLSDADYNRTVVKVSWGSSFGTIFVYLLSPLVLSLWSWKGVFLGSALCGGVMLCLWHRFASDIVPQAVHAEKKDRSPGRNTLFSPLMLTVMAAIVLQGMLRDGVTTWIPSYISETYHMSNAASILSAVVLPIFAIVSFQVSAQLYKRLFTNPLFCAGVIFGVGLLAALLFMIFTGRSSALSVLLAALLTGSMHGVNLILICMIPPFFKNYGNVSTVSGVLNSCTYVGSALSTYGIALLSEKQGWSFTLLIWVCVAAAGTVLCLAGVRAWNRQFAPAQND